ncbi:hypothetical protein HNQ80_001317 [Anaerosolibacter carboniphilus]|uniref:Lipoprotein n=1 Tax=Anaerosolibacter carboniphilus TaxID=1417629 RepID=A0A841KSU8_9FIRM|nr:hypothetical protein [Anaerosolibacter carboniphilus]MBB6215228.1 hypothetical protein [Anaerosolibacter carboniphilus]
MAKYKLIIAVITTALLLTACGNSQPQVAAGTTGQGSQKSEQTAGSNSEENKNNAGQNQGRVQERPDVYGRVKSIIGNEVVLELAEMPERRSGQNGTGQGGTGQNSGSAPAGNQGGQMPPAGNGQMGQVQRSGMQREIKLTGETLTLLIPVGVPVNSFGQGGMKQLDIADIYEGMMMQIWYDKKDEASKTIIRVMVMQGR